MLDAESFSDASVAEPQHVLILYASETGDAQDVAERVARAFRQHRRRAVTLSMDAYNVNDLPHEPLLVLITSTHGRGEPPPAMRGLWSKLIREGLPDEVLEGGSELQLALTIRRPLHCLRARRLVVRALLLCREDARTEDGEPGSTVSCRARMG